MIRKMFWTMVIGAALVFSGCCNEDEVDECMNDCANQTFICYAQIESCYQACEDALNDCLYNCDYQCGGDYWCLDECQNACYDAYDACEANTCGDYSICSNFSYQCEADCPEENGWCGDGGGGCSGGCYYY